VLLCVFEISNGKVTGLLLQSCTVWQQGAWQTGDASQAAQLLQRLERLGKKDAVQQLVAKCLVWSSTCLPVSANLSSHELGRPHTGDAAKR
jgi:hypothetical protein